MRTAKELFKASPVYKDFQTILASPAFEPACNAALMAFIEGLPQNTSAPSESWDCHCKIVGARRVLDILSSLHVSDEPPKRIQSPTLNYNPTTKPK